MVTKTYLCLLILTLLVLCLTVGVSPTAPSPTVLTINSPDGDLIDCINRQDQPAFQHPLLKNHKIQEPPTNVPYTVKTEAETESSWQVWHQNGTTCPEGSVPVRRVTSHQNETSSSNWGDKITKGHEHVIGRMRSPTIYGTQATMNVWQPKIERPDEFSLGQIWLTSGSYNNNDINSIEAGWQVYPRFYQDYQPRFFIYWTTDAYNQTGCYNLECGGFVQTSRTIAVGAAISQTSISGGTQVDLTIRIWKDQKLGSWWLGVVMDHSILEPVGYWPSFIFTLQTDYATKVDWGGEITNMNSFGRHTSTEIGSGFSGNEFGKVAYMRNLKIALSKNDFQPLQILDLGATHLDYYTAKKLNNTFFYYGGPKLIKSQAAHLSLDYIFVFFVSICFCWFSFLFFFLYYMT